MSEGVGLQMHLLAGQQSGDAVATQYVPDDCGSTIHQGNPPPPANSLRLLLVAPPSFAETHAANAIEANRSRARTGDMLRSRVLTT